MSESLLLHVCCGPCASATFGYWSEQGVDFTAFFYNPNIHPLLEYRRRLEGASDACRITGVEFTADTDYDPAAWFARTVPGEGPRCQRCIAARLNRTAQEAASRGITSFSTTLSISPYQDHDAILRGGEKAAEAHGVAFVYRDLRGHYRDSQRLSREWGLYRQKYCGCLLSEWERYRDS